LASVRASYTLFFRPLSDGTKVWYYHARDAKGHRLTARSTGKTTKGEARQYCDELLRNGKLAAAKVPTLLDWTKERHWYEWPRDKEEPLCLYARGRLARSSKDKPAVGRGHIDRCYAHLRDHILPSFGSHRLDEITPGQLEEWLFDLANRFAQKTVINIGSAFRTITAEAFRLELISDDPWKRVPNFVGDSKPRGVLTTAEALKLMNPITVEEVWNGNQVNYFMSLTAMITACRQGELLALRKENIHPDHLDVEASWTIRYHERGPTKTKTKAPVPIPKYLYDALSDFAQWDGYVFSFTLGRTPATGARVTDAFYKALENIGIDEDERDRRNLVFHSWRRFANTYLRSRGLPDAKVRQLTRHESEAMTEHYTSWNADDFSDVSKEQAFLTKALTDDKARAALIDRVDPEEDEPTDSLEPSPPKAAKGAKS
jgi:integrase